MGLVLGGGYGGECEFGFRWWLWWRVCDRFQVMVVVEGMSLVLNGDQVKICNLAECERGAEMMSCTKTKEFSQTFDDQGNKECRSFSMKMLALIVLTYW